MKLTSVSHRLSWFGGTLAVIGLGFVLSLSSGPPTLDSVVTIAPASDLPAGSAALRVAIDPETGTLVPDHNPIKSLDPDLQNMLSRSTAGLKEVVHPDGHVSVDLEGRFMSATLARLDSNGQMETTCVESIDAAAGFLRGENTAHQAGDLEVK